MYREIEAPENPMRSTTGSRPIPLSVTIAFTVFVVVLVVKY